MLIEYYYNINECSYHFIEQYIVTTSLFTHFVKQFD